MSADDYLSATSQDVVSQDVSEISDESGCDIEAYHYWCDLLDGRNMPSVRDLNPAKLEVFKANSYLISFDASEDDYKVRFAGSLLADHGLSSAGLTGQTVSTLEAENIILKLRELYDDVRRNAAPLAFDLPLYRNDEDLMAHGILLPLGEDGRNVSFILGVLKGIEPITAAADAVDAGDDDSIDALLGLDSDAGDPIGDRSDGDEESTDKDNDATAARDDADDQDHLSAWNDEREISGVDDVVEPQGNADRSESAQIMSDESNTSSSEEEPDIADNSDAKFGGYNADEPLINLLSKSRTSAGNINHLDSRSRESLYEVLAQAYAVYEEALLNPSGYEALLRGKGIKVQARAPFTPVIKLIFGVDYDKTRITEYAAALSYAQRNGQTPDTFKSFIMAQPGGIKGCVKAERIAKRKDKGVSADSILDEAREKLRRFNALGSADLRSGAGNNEFVLLLGRKSENESQVDVLGAIEEKEDFVNAVLKRAVKSLRQ